MIADKCNIMVLNGLGEHFSVSFYLKLRVGIHLERSYLLEQHINLRYRHVVIITAQDLLCNEILGFLKYKVLSLICWQNITHNAVWHISFEKFNILANTLITAILGLPAP